MPRQHTTSAHSGGGGGSGTGAISTWRAYLSKTMDAFHFVMFVMASRKSSTTWWPTMRFFSELIQFTGFLISGQFYFGPLTRSYSIAFVDVQFQSPMSAFDFLLRFWGFVIIGGLVLVLSIIIMRNFHSRSFRHIWAIRMLILIAFFLKLITSSSLTVFLAPLVCDARIKQRPLIIGESCTINYVWTIVGIFSLIVIYIFLFAFSFTTYTFSLEGLASPKRNWVAVTDVKFRVGVLGALFVIVFVRQFIYVSLLNNTHPEILAIVNFVVMLSLFLTLVNTIPYHSELINKAYGGLFAVLLWMSTCGLFSVIAGRNFHNPNDNRWFDYVLLFCSPVVIMTGVWLVQRRISWAKAQADWVHGECLHAISAAASASGAGGKGNGGSSRGSPVSAAGGGGGCPVLNHSPSSKTATKSATPLFTAHQLFSSTLESSTAVSLIVRTLVHRDRWSTAATLTREACQLQPDSALMQYLSAWTSDQVHRRNGLGSAASPSPATLDNYYTAASNPEDEINAAYDLVYTKNPGFGLRFLMFKHKMEIEQKATTAGVLGAGGARAGGGAGIGGIEKLDLLQYIELQRAVKNAQTHHVKCVAAIQQFWALFLASGGSGNGARRRKSSSAGQAVPASGGMGGGDKSQAVPFSAFQSAIRTIIKHTQTASQFYMELVNQYPNATQILSAYSNFASLVLNDPDLAEKYAEMARVARQREDELMRNEQQRLMQLAEQQQQQQQHARMGMGSTDGGLKVEGGAEVEGSTNAINVKNTAESVGIGMGNGPMTMSGFSMNAVITIDEDGFIEQVNDGALALFGYDRSRDLRGRKINTLMPFPYKTLHDGLLDRFKTTGENKFLGRRRESWGIHNLGWAFPMRLQVVEMKPINGKKQFAGLVTPSTDHIDPRAAIMLINAQGIVQFVTKPVCDLFGYKPSELVGRNVSVLMPKEVAARHDSFLSRYLATGVSAVIGTAGRNLAGQTKQGVSLPISLRVTQENIHGTVFFRGTMLDVRSLVGEVYMDANGTIVNCNEELLVIFGQTRSNIVGSNVTVLMPEPYKTFHDMYIARYMRTRKSTIIGSPEGRIVPALHADGSVFSITLRVKPVAQEFASATATDSGIAFQGTIIRVSTEAAENFQQFKPNKDKMVSVDSYGTITAIGPKMLRLCTNSSNNSESTALTTTSSYYVDRPAAILFPPLSKYPAQVTIRALMEHLRNNLNEFVVASIVRRDRTVVPVALLAPDQLFVGDGKDDLALSICVEDLRSMECLIMLSWRGDLVRANDAIIGLFGYSMDNLLGQKLSKLLVDFSPDKHLGGTISGGSAAAMMRLSLTGKHRDGSTFPVWFDVIRTVQNDEYFYVGRIAYSGAVEKLTPAELEKVMEQVPNLGISSNSIVFSQVELHNQAGPKITHMSHNDSDTGGDSSNSAIPPRAGPALVVSNAEESDDSVPDAAAAITTDSGGQKQGMKSMRFSPSVQSRIGLGVGVSKSEKEHSEEGHGNDDFKSTRVRATAEMLDEEPSHTSASHLSPPTSTPIPSMLGLISGTLTRTVPSIGRQSQRPPTIASEPGGDGSSSEYESTSSARVSRELRMILTWKSARVNPLHRSVQNRLKLGLLLLLASTISIMVVLMQIRHTSEPMLALTSDMELTALLGEITLNAEIMHFCRVGAGAAVSNSQPSPTWSASICSLNYSGALKSLASTLSDTAQTMYILARSQPALTSVAQQDWTLEQFVSPDPMISTKVTLPDFWQLSARMSAAANSTSYIVGDPSADRSWRFLVANKPVLNQAASTLSDNVISSISSEWWHYVVVMLALYATNIFLTIFIFFANIFPGLRSLNYERTRALRLLMQVPRSVIAYLVNHVYAVDEDDADLYNEGLEQDGTLATAPAIVRDAERPPPSAVSKTMLVTQLTDSDMSSCESRSALGSHAGMRSNHGSLRRKSVPSIHAAIHSSSSPSCSATDIRAGSDAKPLLFTCGLLGLAILPLLVGLGLFLSEEFSAIHQDMSTLKVSTELYASAFAFPGIAFEGLRALTHPSSGVATAWDSATLSKLATFISNTFNIVQTTHIASESSIMYANLFTYEYSPRNRTVLEAHGVSIPIEIAAGLPSRLISVQSSRGFAFVLSDTVDAISALANSGFATNVAPLPTSSIPSSVRASLINAAITTPLDFHLGMEMLCRMHLTSALGQANHVYSEAAMIHGVDIAILVATFVILWIIQARMREEIKLHCVLLLMIPPTFLKAQRGLMQYIREVCVQLRKYFPGIGAGMDGPMASATMRRSTSSAAGGGYGLQGMDSGGPGSRRGTVGPGRMGQGFPNGAKS